MTLLEKWNKLLSDYKWSSLYTSWAFLACVSALLERRCWYNGQILGRIYPNLYVVLVGGAGSGKTTVAERATEWLLEGLPNQPIRSSNVLTPAALIKEMKRSYDEKGFRTGTSCLFTYSSELGLFIKDIGGGDIIDLLIDFYDSRRPGQLWTKTLIKDGKTEIMSPQLTLLGCTTPNWIQRTRLIDTAGIGFTGRTIFCHEDLFSPRLSRFPQVDQELLAQLRDEMKRISLLEGEFIVMNGAQAELDSLVDEINHWLSEHRNSDGIFHAYMGRKLANILKVSMLLSACRNNERIILGEDVSLAKALFKALEPNLLSAFGTTIKHKDESLMQNIMTKFSYGDEMSEAKLVALFEMEGQSIPINQEYLSSIDGLRVLGRLQVDIRNGMRYFKRIR